MWIEAICRLAPFYSINAKYRRMFQLTNPDTTAAQEIRLVLLSSYTVEEALEHIFDHVSSVAKTVARNYKDYALKITGARSYLFDLQQKLCSYQHVRSCVFPKRTLRLTLVLRSELRGPELLKALSLPQRSFDDKINSPSPDIKGQIAKSCDFGIPLRFSINRVVNIPSFVMIMKESKKLLERRPLTHGHCIVKVELFNGGVLIDAPIETNPARLKPAPGQSLSALWDTSRSYETKLRLNSIPKSARIVLTLYGVKVNSLGIVSSSMRERILSTGMNMFDSHGFLTQGDQYIQMTADMSKYDCGAVLHAVDENKPLIHIKFASHDAQVGFNWSSSLDITSPQENKFYALDAQLRESKQGNLIRSDSRGVNFKNFVNKFKFSKSSSSISDQSLSRSSSINFRDYFVENPLGNYTPNEKKMMWTSRHEFVDYFNALPHVLSCVNWSNPNQVNEILGMLPLWSPPSHPAAYIRLLDKEFANEGLREFALQKISTMADATFSCFLPQLVQALKHENHHVSPLAKLLMARAIKNPNQIGFDLFWAIKAEAHSPQYRERFGVLLNTYTEICSPQIRSILEVQDKLFSETGELVSIARMVKHFYQTGKTKEEIHSAMRERLAKLNDILPPSLLLPLDSTIEVGKIAVQKCKITNFSHAPLWLEFDNAEEGGDPVVIIFRSDEDVRQECLVLQLIRLMDELWRDLGKDYAIEPYKCVSTGPTTGIVQVFRHSVTRAAIQRRIGGMIAWKDDRSIMSWISANNGDSHSYMTAVDLFLRSCAGYCVATYVLGVGERNSANIMMTKEGRFFHVALRNFLDHPKNLVSYDASPSGLDS
ncbi:hypothetical protein AeMF1_014638 [Aphanomyces euteiches]|nr:hypothetical protein AeMF1_014638 [Aphanomyces euteiches]KAH9183006.1 hypothetical protein AeNC1_015018 [Aphanomyces euteiches]